MRVLIHAGYYAPELIAIGKYNHEMACWLRDHGHEVRVVAMAPHFPQWRVHDGHTAAWWSRRQVDGIPVWRCPQYIPRRPTAVGRLLWMGTFALTSIPTMIRQAFWRPDVVIGVEPPLLAFAAARSCAALCGARLWLHVQDLEVDAAFDLGVLRGSLARRMAARLERMLMRGCAQISTISSRMRERLIAKGVPGDQVTVLRNWVGFDAAPSAEDCRALRERLDLPPESALALYAGNMGAKQGLETLVDAARLLVDRSEVIVLFVGEGASQPALRRLADGLPNVRFLPLQPADDFHVLVHAVDVHLLPQRAAASDLVMPSKLGAMMASGRPVVAGALPGTELSEVLGTRGVVVPPEDASAFADAIAMLVDDPDHGHRLGLRAHAWARSNLDKEVVLSALDQQLRRYSVFKGQGASA